VLLWRAVREGTEQRGGIPLGGQAAGAKTCLTGNSAFPHRTYQVTHQISRITYHASGQSEQFIGIPEDTPAQQTEYQDGQHDGAAVRHHLLSIPAISAERRLMPDAMVARFSSTIFSYKCGGFFVPFSDSRRPMRNAIDFC
jgi:hypothetical protein